MEKQIQLGTRWKRFGACVIDLLIMIFMILPLDLLLMGGKIKPITELEPQKQLYYYISICVIFMLINGHLLQRRGQTLGKMCMKLKIVDALGDVPKFWRLLVRSISFVLIMVPSVNLLSFFNGLFIFKRDRRCLHDMLAGTRVAAKTQSATASFDRQSGDPPYTRTFARNDISICLFPLLALNFYYFVLYYMLLRTDIFFAAYYFILMVFMGGLFFWSRSIPYIYMTEQGLTVKIAMVRQTRTAAWSEIAGMQRKGKYGLHVLLKDNTTVKLTLFAINHEDRDSLLRILEYKSQQAGSQPAPPAEVPQ